MRVTTREMGQIEVAHNMVLEFTSPLVGFESCRRYVLLPVKDAAPFHWLQSIENPQIAFPVVPAGEVGVQYAPGTSTRNRVAAATPHELTFWVIVAFASGRAPMSVNLRAPIVLNRRRRLAAQVVICDDVPNKTPAAHTRAEPCLLHA